jgi:hypothetical protein
MVGQPSRTERCRFIKTNAIGRGRTVAALAATLAAGPLILSAIAHADPDAPAEDPRVQCESPEFGGVFIATTTPDGVAHAVCQYIVEGQFYYDNYDNGTYTGTLVYRDGAKVPTERPVMPGLLNIPGGLPLIMFPGQF